ncbi:response regulator transcription factor [Dechloromonas sp. HYN0024]|uniref:response regulator n=1 Tax=Dechloromonas sp. HYN0024 TaxID=2231055 RepID=UPI000E43E382|nr:response regulator transcription factor [Dechloromonas sp. HYN0024]AXS81037.1 DNA-binding response regulator [Dechloromonas sp. HYN0024]
MSKYTILIAEDYALIRAGIRSLLAAEADLEVVGEVDNGKDAVRQAVALNPSLVLMDLSMPGSNGMDAIGEIKRRNPDTRVLVLTMHKTDEYIQEALRMGASGYILKESSYNELITGVRTVLSGKIYLSPDVSERVVNSFIMSPPAATPNNTGGSTWNSLTVREREVIKLVAEGSSNKEIAEYLCLSIKTVEKHRSSLMRKLNLRNSAMLIAYAIEKGIVTL